MRPVQGRVQIGWLWLLSGLFGRPDRWRFGRVFLSSLGSLSLLPWLCQGQMRADRTAEKNAFRKGRLMPRLENRDGASQTHQNQANSSPESLQSLKGASSLACRKQSVFRSRQACVCACVCVCVFQTWSERLVSDHSSAVWFCWTERARVRLVRRPAALLRLAVLRGSAAVQTLTASCLGGFSIVRPRRRREPLHDGIHHAGVSGPCGHRHWA